MNHRIIIPRFLLIAWLAFLTVYFFLSCFDIPDIKLGEVYGWQLPVEGASILLPTIFFSYFAFRTCLGAVKSCLPLSFWLAAVFLPMLFDMPRPMPTHPAGEVCGPSLMLGMILFVAPTVLFCKVAFNRERE